MNPLELVIRYFPTEKLEQRFQLDILSDSKVIKINY